MFSPVLLLVITSLLFYRKKLCEWKRWGRNKLLLIQIFLATPYLLPQSGGFDEEMAVVWLPLIYGLPIASWIVFFQCLRRYRVTPGQSETGVNNT